MNFPNMPIVNSPFGFTSLLLLMIGIAAVMLLYFRTKRWI